MGKIRVIIVDDAIVVRKLISDALSDDPELEVAGVAADGRIAIAKIPRINPDLVLLDMEMPNMNGLETLKALRQTHPRLPVIMFSTLTERGASATLDALAAGANDYLAKPGNVGSVFETQAIIREELIPKIKALCGISGTAASTPLPKLRKPLTKTKIAACSKIDAIVIGISTGGPNALEVVIPNLPQGLQVPIFIVQHMPPVFTKSFADRLNKHSKVQVFEAEDGMTAKAGCVYIAPGGFHLTIKRNGLDIIMETNQGPLENSCRPSADVLFRHAANVFKKNLLGVIMTGMGQDGLHGCEDIAEVGGQIIVQNQETSVVWGMPGFVTKAGLADRVLPLQEIAAEITRRTFFQRK